MPKITHGPARCQLGHPTAPASGALGWVIRYLVLVSAVLSALPAASIMIPPEEIEHGIIEAPEVADILVQRVRVSEESNLWGQVSVTAQVISVIKSASGLERGQVIHLSYEVPGELIPSGYFGPPVPHEGGAFTAYLDLARDGRSYTPRDLREVLGEEPY